jgi:TRAP-type mannitol/chloroaromatic compound transport system permease small subunit
MTFLRGLDRAIAAVIATAQWLALPLILLLFLQWPLRDIVRAHSTQANDLGQIFFALYVAVSISAATRAGTHLAADTLAQHYTARTRAWLKRLGAGLGILPWALFVLIASEIFIIPSVKELEEFPETSNPGYFLVKCALWLMAGTIIAQSIVEIFRPLPRDDV